MRQIHRLSALQITRLKQPGKYPDGAGLHLQVSPTGSKSWLLRYQRDGNQHWLGLGPLHTVGLVDARERARRARLSLLDGVDPLVKKRADRETAKAALVAIAVEAAKQVTFRQTSERFIADQRAGWKNSKHADQWLSTLQRYAFPVIGDLPVASIDLGHITSILRPIWTTRTETASRVRGRIEAILAWSTVNGYRKGDNPAKWSGLLDKVLPARTKVRKIKPQPSLPWSDVPAFVAKLGAQPSTSANALEFLILTAARTGEVTGATWSEIDLANATWTIPAGRMKAGAAHDVPLSKRAVDILDGLPRETDNPFVFIGAKARRGLSNQAMLELVRGLHPGVVVHGFRSSFRTWCGGATNFPREVAEAALAHSNKDKSEAAYARTTLLAKRRRLMEAWSKFVGTPKRATDTANVVQIGEAA